MKRQIDHFLLGLLWLLAVALGANFWFNTKYGFNIFSGAHWEYLGQMQAARVPVNTWFYISLVIVVVVMIVGLYLLVRPRFRKIRFAVSPAAIPKEDASEIDLVPSEPVVPEKQPTDPYTVRPPKLNISPVHNNYQTPTPAENKTGTDHAKDDLTIATPASTSPDTFKEIEDIFTSVGYLVKKSPRLGNMRPALLAIGADESLWIGAIGIEPARLVPAVEQLQSIFNETLQDIDISIHPFVVMPKTDDALPDMAIDLFDSIDDLRRYMDDHRNKELTEEDKDNFDAYSEYIDTVTNYLNNT